MSLSIGELVGYLKLDDSDYERGLAGAERRAGRFGGFLAKSAKVAAGAAVAGIGAMAVGGIKQFAALEQGMNEVFTLMPGISQGAMDDMTGQVKGFASEFGVLPNDVVPALYQSLSAGVPAGNVFDFLETAQKAAKGGVTDLTTAVDGISSVVNAYGSEVMDATKASDLMFTAVKLGKTDFSQLSANLSKVTPIASALGVGFEDVTASLAVMTGQGEGTAEATTKLKTVMAELAKGGSVAFDAFKEATGKTFPDFIAEGGNLGDGLQAMRKHAESSGDSLLDMFGSVEAGQGALMLTGEKAGDLRKAMAEMDNSAGATEAAFEQMDQGLAASWDKIKAAGSVALIDIGDALAPMAAQMAAFAEDLLPKVVAAVGRLPGAIDRVVGVLRDAQQTWKDHRTTITVVAAVIAALMIPRLAQLTVAHVKAKIQAVKAWLAIQKAAFKAAARVAKAAARVAVAMLRMAAKALVAAARMAASWLIAMGPIGWAIAAVAGLAVLIFRYWDRISSATSRAWRVVVRYITDAWQSVKAGTVEKVGSLLDYVRGIPGRIVSAVGDLGGLLKGAGRAILQGLIDGVTSMLGSLKDKLSVVTKLIPDWKGPMDLDARLLTPNGAAIMDGLVAGIDQQTPKLQRTLGNITEGIPRAVEKHTRVERTVVERSGPLIGNVTQQPGEDPDLLAERLWFKTRTRG